MDTTVFSKPGRFFRGNLHTHSNRSDGALPPEEVCRRYKAHGYDFIALTDHFVGRYAYPITDTAPWRDNRFTTILGAEIHSGAMENGELWHILAVGLPADFAPPRAPDFDARTDQETGPQLARRAHNAGAYVAIAHPHWSGLTLEDALSIEAAHAVEAYNHGCAIDSDRGEGFLTLDLLLSRGKRLHLCTTDDAHFGQPDHFGGWVMVKAEENRPDSLLEALKAGDYYSSQGPDFHDIACDGDRIEVAMSAVSRVIVQGQGSASRVVIGETMTRAEIALSGRLAASPWLRVTLADAAGKRAWSNPIWR